MVLYGVHPVTELLRRLAAEGRGARHGLVLLLARDNATLRRLRGQARALGIPVRAVTVAELAAHCGSDAHRGVALVDAPRSAPRPAPDDAGRRGTHGAAPGGGGRAAGPGPTAGPEAVTTPGKPAGRPQAFRPAVLRDYLPVLAQRPTALVVVADGVTDPMNLGSITRSADQFGADLVLVPRRRAARVTDTVMRASAGAAAHVATVAVANVAAALEQLKGAGCWIYGADLEGKPLDQARFPARVALVLGAEGGGLHALVRSRCDDLVRIPTAGQVDSLNVGVAAGILMYEVRRQQRVAEMI